MTGTLPLLSFFKTILTSATITMPIFHSLTIQHSLFLIQTQTKNMYQYRMLHENRLTVHCCSPRAPYDAYQEFIHLTLIGEFRKQKTCIKIPILMFRCRR